MGPRRVGRVMSQYGAATTWWRVVRAGGHPPAGLEDEALAHWRAEGTPLVGGPFGGGGSTCTVPGGTARRAGVLSVACDGVPAC